MSARPILAGLKTISRSSPALHPARLLYTAGIRASANVTRPAAASSPFLTTTGVHSFHNTAFTGKPAVEPTSSTSTPTSTPAQTIIETPVMTSSHGEADRNEDAEAADLFAPPPEPLNATDAAFLGEADSNDHIEGERVIRPPPDEPLDASASAFLGEADSDDHVEGEWAVRPPPEVPLDASSAAFLGEADSNDFVEGDDAVTPRDHGPLDTSESAFHGEAGSHDQ